MLCRQNWTGHHTLKLSRWEPNHFVSCSEWHQRRIATPSQQHSLCWRTNEAIRLTNIAILTSGARLRSRLMLATTKDHDIQVMTVSHALMHKTWHELLGGHQWSSLPNDILLMHNRNGAIELAWGACTITLTYNVGDGGLRCWICSVRFACFLESPRAKSIDENIKSG